jgi:molybdenum cofactor biosynthesis enzyme MoaA
MCRAPFTAMEFAPDGSVLACCANYLHPLGFVGRGQSLRDIWTGPAAQRLRSAITAGDLSLGCTICSHRIRHQGAELPLLAYDQLDLTEGGEWPTSLSFSLHNTCNLECIMCGGDRSSRIRTRRLGLPPLPHRYGEDFFEQVGELIAHASWCDFVGGEPLLIREHWRVWDIMREVSPGMRCAITTNGTVWNRRVESLLDDFPTAVRISMDGITAATFERVRVGADFPSFLANFERFHRYSRERGTEMTISWSFVQQNWFELADALAWAEEQGVWAYVTTVLERDYGVQHLPTAELSDVYQRMQAQSEQVRPHLQINRETWDRQLAMVAAELASRDVTRVGEACFDAPEPDSCRLVADTITRHDWAIDAEPTAPDLATYAAAWGLDLDAADDLVTDPDGRVRSHRGGVGGPVVEAWQGADTLADVLERLCGRLRGQMWRVEELQLRDAFVCSVAVGASGRDGDDMQVFRLIARRRDAEEVIDVAVAPVARDDHLATPISIRPRRAD